MNYSNSHIVKTELWQDYGIRFQPHLIGPRDTRWPNEHSFTKERVEERIKYIDEHLLSNPDLKNKFYAVIFEDLSLEKEVLDHVWSRMSDTEQKLFVADANNSILENMASKLFKGSTIVVDRVINDKNIKFAHDFLIDIGLSITAGDKLKPHPAIKKLCKFAWSNFKLMSKPHIGKYEVTDLDSYEALYLCLKTMYPLKDYINDESVRFQEIKTILELVSQTHADSEAFLKDLSDILDTKPMQFVKPNLIILELLDLKLHADEDTFWKTLFTRNKKEAHAELPRVDF